MVKDGVTYYEPASSTFITDAAGVRYYKVDLSA
jgi:protein associated with RNAse G/E